MADSASSTKATSSSTTSTTATTASSSSRTTTSVEVPSVDRREYRWVALRPTYHDDDGNHHPHGLDVLLIHDATTDKASAACDVHIGQLCDPPTLPGLAHFCEHMVFIGNEKYPTENAYDQFLHTHGGSSNAFTDLEHTCYYFDVQANCLEGALDRFAQCLISPLFTPSALEREIQAVDSEHAKNLQQDLWRTHQLIKHRLLLPSSTHPYKSFGSGNVQSLGNDGQELRNQVMQFYQRFYRKSLGLYKLVVLGKESCDDLQAIVERCFHEWLTNRDFFSCIMDATQGTLPRVQDMIQELYPTILNQVQLPQRIHAVPIAQIPTLEMVFPLPEIQSHYQGKPTRYLSHLIGHEGKGSLLSLLKAKQYAQALYTDDSSHSYTSFAMFVIKIELTPAGLDVVNEVIQIVFAYIQLLQTMTPQQWIFQELQTTGALQFRFLSQQNPMDYTCTLAGSMQLYPPHHCISGPYQFWEWDPTSVSQYLNAIHPENVMIVIQSPTFDTQEQQTTSTTTTAINGDNDTEGSVSSPSPPSPHPYQPQQIEPWYGTKYEVIDLPTTLLEQWKTARAADYPELDLPLRNDMIATDFTLLHHADEESTMPKDQPICIRDTSNCRLWYKPDNVFEMPKVNISMLIQTRHAYSTCEAAVCTHLWTELLQEICNEFTYLASMARLHCDVAHTPNGIELHVSGYNHKASVLLQKVVECMVDLPQRTSLELFDRIQDKLIKQYSTFLVASPYSHAIYSSDLCLEHVVSWTHFDKLAALQAITYQDIQIFGTSRYLFHHCKVEGLIHGNVSIHEAHEMTDMILNHIQPNPNTNDRLYHPLEHRVVAMSMGTSYRYALKEFNEADTNSCCHMLFQIGSMEYDENARLVIFHHLIREPAFHQLRTEEQLGYIVHSSIKTSGDTIKGLLLLIQSDAFDPMYLESRIEAFLQTVRQRIVSMPEEDFAKNIHAVVANLLEKVRFFVHYFLVPSLSI